MYQSFLPGRNVSTRWVLTDKIISGQRKVKARLAKKVKARDFEEKNEELLKDSLACAKESLYGLFLRLLLQGNGRFTQLT